ncbi:MAG TPA: SDR family oxidoreductase [Mycobacteriales bacterium]|nr:SDR family oxidoreductase [Mycobacteriales bacterium]
MSRSVVVTGANSGIGLATALELAGAGFAVTGTVRSPDKAEALRGQASDRGLTVDTAVLDVTDAESTAAGFATIAARTDIWAVVNNAGIAQAGSVEDVTDEEVRDQLEVNLVAPARIARLVLPGMRKRGGGRIVNVSSIAGRISLPLMGWYCASKHGLEAMTDALRMEVAPYGIAVSLVEPGSFGTGIWGSARYPDAPATEEYAAGYARARSSTTGGGMARAMPDPVWVARTVRLALSSPVPLARYLVGFDAVGGLVAERLVPTALTDMVKEVASGLRRLPLRS